MITAIRAIKQALAHGTYTNTSIKDSMLELIDSLDTDLTEAGYEQGDQVTLSENELVAVLDEADESTEGLDEAAREGATLEEDDEN